MIKLSLNFYLIFYQQNNISSSESVWKFEKICLFQFRFNVVSEHGLHCHIGIAMIKLLWIKHPKFQRLQDVIEEIEFWRALTTSSGRKYISFLIMSHSSIVNGKVLTSLKHCVGLSRIELGISWDMQFPEHIKFLRQSDFLQRNVWGSFPPKQQNRKKIHSYSFKNLNFLGVGWMKLKRWVLF